MPRPRDATLRFRQWGHQMRHDYVIYADFESIIVPYNSPCPDPAVSSTTRDSRHVPCGFCYVIVKADGTLLKEPVLEHGEKDIVKRFLQCLQEEVKHITELRGELYELDMSEEQEKDFQKATNCYMCGDAVPRAGVKKVRDHDWSKAEHNYRGAACQYPCNLNLKRKTYIPVLMHNLKNYDAHMVLSEIGQLSDGSDISVIPRNKEKYVSFQWGVLRFLDSLGFLNSSLDRLIADLTDDDMSLLKSIYPAKETRALVSRKGVYPYSYFDSFAKFKETSLPPPEAFKNDLTGVDVKPEDYEHALNVYKKFNMSTLQDYHDLYLLTDTVLLADCMEAFRRMAMGHYNLDPVHFYTTPGMAFSASLLFTKQSLELLSDLETHLLFERGLRGGVASVQHRYIEANNKYIPETFTDSKPSSYIMYYDANSLYATALCSKLPTVKEIDDFDPANISAESDVGYLFVVDMAYPKHLHDAHNDYPLAPEHMVPQYEDLSKLQKKMLRDFQFFEVFNHDLVCVERKKAKVVLNRPLFVGQVCLDISKKIMYEFYYKVRYGENIAVAAGDTDSLIVQIFTEDVYADMNEMRQFFDTSDYPKNHPLYSLENKKVMGKFKDGLNSEPVQAFVGLRAKMYSFKTVSQKEKSVGKGIPREALKSQLTFDD
ncbi:LOW QUALITY PROTEIN: hypothetical protein KUF71_007457 [Frankliniella fusca]|uniref:DNA-directed DNA polymerase n=1 Tax=Frankliniella fusca TaxID=407009 RepID=A0AAE1LVQ0_9NEOP|nr:LOW QUALITY PROTEIN: hypothetical protein KUF71_007457 [Frankliniella fusca]